MGQFARTSSEPLSADVCENSQKDGANFVASSSTMNPNEIDTSSCKISKRAKKDDNVVDGSVQAIDRGIQTLSALVDAIKEAAVAKTTLPVGLFKIVGNLPGFELEHKSRYYAYLVANPEIARVFMSLPFHSISLPIQSL
jgi:hypothetical protein